jgi:hypothetical protein
MQTDRDERRTCPVRAYLSSTGKRLLNSKMSIDSRYALVYTVSSLTDFALMLDLLV